MNIYDIAEIAHVSPSTVSKVINNRAGVSTEIRNRVLKVIEEQSFTPKTAVNDSINIAVVSRTSNYQGNMFYSNFFVGLMRGASEFAFDHGYGLTLFSSLAVPKTRNPFSLFCRKHNLAGIIFGNLQSDDQFIEEIAGIIPVVVINSHYTGDKVYSICSDNNAGMYEAVKYLYEMNHRRIAILGHGLNYEDHSTRMKGFKRAVSDFELAMDDDYVMNIDNLSPASVCYRFERLKQEGKMPSALLTMNDDSAGQIISYLRLVGIQCPRDISVIGFDDYDYSVNFYPALTTIKQALHEKGRLAAQLASGSPSDPSVPRDKNGVYVFKTQLIVRDSAMPVPLTATAGEFIRLNATQGRR